MDSAIGMGCEYVWTAIFTLHSFWDACRAGNGPGAGACAFRRYECGDIRYRRNRAHSAGCQYGASAIANQAAIIY